MFAASWRAVTRETVIRRIWMMNRQRNVQNMAWYCLVLYNSISLDCKILLEAYVSPSIFQKQSKRGGEGEKESTAKTRRPSKNVASKLDIGTTSLIGNIRISLTPECWWYRILELF